MAALQETTPLEMTTSPEMAEVYRLSRLVFDDYFDSRQSQSKVDGTLCHDAVAEWIEQSDAVPTFDKFTKEEYATPNREAVTQRFQHLEDFLTARFPDLVSKDDIQVTKQFLNATFSMYEDTPRDGSVAEDADGSFAFVVPARMSRENTEYGQEVEQVIPLLKYVPRNVRAGLMVGLPPFVIDRYNVDEHGKRGYLVFAPMYPDMIADLEVDDLFDVATQKVNEAVDFAYHRLGTKVIGLGAILPGITDFGKTITNPNVITTTGHGGTVHLILETVKRAHNEGRIATEQVKRIGVLGLGSIGASIASVVHESYSDATTTIYDTKKSAVFRTHKATGLPTAESVTDLINKSDVLISAVTTKIDLDELGLSPDALTGKVIVDDSQPACFDPEQVQAYGGTVAWVVGRDGDSIMRGSYSYGETMHDEQKDLFGCEAEAATLSARYQEYLAAGVSEHDAAAEIRKIAIRERVNPTLVRNIGQLFVRYGVSAAPLQAFGTLV